MIRSSASCRGVVAGPVALLVGVTVISCGVPTSGPVRTVDSADVPFGLAAPRTSSTRSSDLSTNADSGPGLYFIRGKRLVFTGLKPSSGSVTAQLEEIMAALSAGPTADQQAAGTGTAIPAGMIVRLDAVSDNTAHIEITGESARPDVVQNALVAGQIVLSATSVPGIDGVLLARRGQGVAAALPDGTLADGVVRAEDFSSLLATGALTPSMT